MTGWLLDTDIISEINKKRPERRVVRFITAQPLEELYLSTITLAEIRYGIEKAEDLVRRADLTAWLDQRLRPMFEDRILPVSEDVILRWKIMVKEGQKVGHTFSQPDLFIAATAAHHQLTVVTGNSRHFERTGVSIFNPWAD